MENISTGVFRPDPIHVYLFHSQPLAQLPNVLLQMPDIVKLQFQLVEGSQFEPDSASTFTAAT